MNDVWINYMANLRLKLSLLALPCYVWPIERVKSRVRTFLGLLQPEIQHIIANASIRWLSRMLSTSQFNIATTSPTPAETILDAAPELKELGAYTLEVKEPNFRATFIPKVPAATHLVFYIHGGGFVSGSATSIAQYLLQMFVELHRQGLTCEILSIDYDLSPGAVYPTAIGQLAHAYKYAASFGKPIILAGDSAGGNLALSLLQHLDQPHPLLPSITIPSDGAEIVAACLLSPWVNLRNEGASVHANSTFDCLDISVLRAWVGYYLGPEGVFDCYNNPIDRRKKWNTILPRKTMILAGSMEMFLSDILAFSSNVQKDGYEGLEVVVTPLKCHDWPAVDYGTGFSNFPVHTGHQETLNMTSSLQGLRLQAEWITKVAISK